MQVLGTFQSRDAADAVKDAFIAAGFNAADLVVLANRASAEPPEDAELEVGTAGEGGMKELQEKVGKAVMSMMGSKNTLDGDGSEGAGNAGALLGVTLAEGTDPAHVIAMLERHHASDVEIAQQD